MAWRFNKYSARKQYSELCGRMFDSKAEAKRGEELALLERAGEIKNLQYQVKFVLHHKPIISIKVDFVYQENDTTVYEDAKGFETREFRVKRYWLEEQQGIKIRLIKKG